VCEWASGVGVGVGVGVGDLGEGEEGLEGLVGGECK